MRTVLAIALALALSSAVCAQTVAPPASPSPSQRALRVEQVVVRPFQRPENRWLWFREDGSARFSGTLRERSGRFRARVNYQRVVAIVDDAGLCDVTASPFREAQLTRAEFRVDVRCGNAWRTYTTLPQFRDAANPGVRRAALALEELAATLAWEPSSDAPRPPLSL